MKTVLTPLEDRFWAKVDRSGGPEACWPWTGVPMADGYGHLSIGRRGSKHVRAHRLAYDLAHPDAPLGARRALHSCDNPPCCNAAHIFAGTQADNMADMLAKGRGRWQRKAANG